LRRGKLTRDYVEECRLPGTVGTDDAPLLSGGHLHRYVLDRSKPPEVLRDVIYDESVLRGGRMRLTLSVGQHPLHGGNLREYVGFSRKSSASNVQNCDTWSNVWITEF
jgi:hypothetical protein